MHLHFPYCLYKNIILLLKMFDQWHVCTSPCVFGILLSKFSLFSTFCGGQLNLLCAVEVCRTPH